MIKEVSELIDRGDYQKALLNKKLLQNKFWLFVYFSKVHELTGYFKIALLNAMNAENISFLPIEKISCTATKAYALWRLTKYNTALNLLKKDPSSKDKGQSEIYWISNYYNIKGLILWSTNSLEAALDNFNKSLLLRENLKNEIIVSYSLNNLGNTHLKLREFDVAKKYFQKSIEIRIKLGYLPALAASHNSMARLEDDRGNYENAEVLHQRSFNLWQEVGNIQFIAKSLRYLGLNALFRNEQEFARKYFRQSDNYFSSLNNQIDLEKNNQLKTKFNLLNLNNS